jgi:hypothetical protein
LSISREATAGYESRHRFDLIAPNRRQAFDDASRATISDMSALLMNSFIFEMIYCKRLAKNAPKAIANGGDICTNHRTSATVALVNKIAQCMIRLLVT